MFRLVVLSCLLALARSAALPQKIVGGFTVDISQIPYQVSLQDDGHFCGGTLLSSTIVITAAHCTIDKDSHDIAVRIGSTRSDTGGVLIPVRAIIEHPYYDDDTKDYDISILILAFPQTYTTEFPPLPTWSTMFQDGDWALVSGWGDTKNAAESSDILRAVYVPIVNHDECSEFYETHGGVTDQMVCAGDPENGGIDSCQGDSGGPMTVNGVFTGVVSWGVGCGSVGYPGVYTLVYSVRDWIREMVNL